MGFHPDRLTGRRARQWRKSVNWKGAPEAPKTLLAMLHRPEHLRAFGRVKTVNGTFHYVALVRDRVIFPQHLMDRKTARKLGGTLDALSDSPDGFLCSTCEECLQKWGDITSRDNVESLPSGLLLALSKRKPGIRREVIDFSKEKTAEWRSRENILAVTRELQGDDPVHPRPWVEPETPAVRWKTPRRMNGNAPRSLNGLLRGEFLWLVRQLFPDITVKINNAFDCPVPGGGWRAISDDKNPSNTSVKVVNNKATKEVYLEFQVNLFNWYPRAEYRDRAVIGPWLILVPGKGPTPDSPVICDAVNVDLIRSRIAEAKLPVVPLSNTGLTNFPVELTHGVLNLTPSGWAFDPVQPKASNRVLSENQIVPARYWPKKPSP